MATPLEGISATKRYGQVAIEKTPLTLSGNPVYYPMGETTEIGRDFNRTRIPIEATREMENVAEYHGMQEAAYTHEFKLTNGRIFFLALGNDDITPAAPLASDFTHVITGESTTLPYHRMEVQDLLATNSDFIDGCWVESFTMNATQNDTVNCSVSGLGLKNSWGASTAIKKPDHAANVESTTSTVTYNGEPYRFQMGTAKLYDPTPTATTFTLDPILHSFELSISNTLIRGPAFGDTFANYHTLQKREMTCNITIDIDDQTTPIVRALVETEVAFEISLVLVRVDEEATATDDTITLHFPDCKVFNHDKDYSDSIRTTLACIISNPTPATTPVAVGTFGGVNKGWVIEIIDQIDAYNQFDSSTADGI